MDKSLDFHRREIISKALELWEEKSELRDIEKDPIVKLLLSALAYQSHSVLKEMETLKEETINEFRNKMIPYYLIKPFPAYSIIQTKIKENLKDKLVPLTTYWVNEQSSFEFGKKKYPFVPLFNTKIIQATITDKDVNRDTSSIDLTLTCSEVIEDFSGMSFYLEGIGVNEDVDIFIDNKKLPVIKPYEYENLPFSELFQSHFLLSEDNQLQIGCYDYWQELYLKNQIQFFYIGEYNPDRIINRNLSPVFSIRFKNLLKQEYLNDCSVKINCFPVLNVQQNSEYLTDDEPVKKLSADNSTFLNLLVDIHTDNHIDDFIIRHYGLERYSHKELLFQLNDLFNRFISDYYAFKDIEELKKGEKMETIYKTFREILPVIKQDTDDVHPSVYAILKLSEKLTRPSDSVKVNFLTTNCELANGISKGEKPVTISEFLDKEKTVLLQDTAGGRKEERNEANINHLARYNLLTKDKLVTAADLKALCYRELKDKIRNVSVKNTGEQINILITLKDDYFPEQKEKAFYESVIQQKINARSLLCIPVSVVITV